MRLSEHFTLAELTVSANAVRLGLSNAPPPAIVARLKTVAGQLERIRELVGGKPIRVTSGYRSEAVNTAAGGAKTSAHREGWAMDIQCPQYGTPLQLAERIARSALTFDQLIHEHGVWVHISFDPRRRGELLTIDRLGTRPGLLAARS